MAIYEIMNICILTHTFPRNKQDVAAAFMKEFADGLTQVGNKVVVLTPFDTKFSRSGDIFKIVTYKYIWPEKYHILGYSQTMGSDVKLRKRAYLLLPFMIFFGVMALYHTVKKYKISLINVHWILPNGLIALIVSKITEVPYVITLPGTDAYLAYKNKAFGLVALIIAQNSKGIVSNSSWHLKRILTLGKINKPTAVISYPADVSSFRTITNGLDIYRKKHDLERKNFVILAVGRLVYKKGFDYLIRAMPKVLKRYPHTRLVIGGEGDVRESLVNLAKKLKVEKKVIFAGTINRDEIIYYYNIADIMVAPSIVDKDGNVDGGPLVSLESMACGKPQILTEILGMADEIENGIHGLIVPQKDSAALSDAIIKLIASPKLRKEMGQNSRKLAMKNLSTQNIGKRYNEFFNEL